MQPQSTTVCSVLSFGIVSMRQQPRKFLVLRACLDESGQEGDAYVFIAGFLGDEISWSRFSEAWKAALQPRPHLHMRKLRWNKDSTRALLARLGPVPRESGLKGVVGGVRVSDYTDLLAGSSTERLFPGYIVALYPLVINILRWMPRHEHIEFVFERQDRYSDLAGKVLEALLNLTPAIAARFGTTIDDILDSGGRTKIAGWTFAPKKSSVFMQPADYLAYALTQWYRDKASLKSQWCLPIIGDENAEGVGRILSRDEARQSAAFIREWARVHGP